RSRNEYARRRAANARHAVAAHDSLSTSDGWGFRCRGKAGGRGSSVGSSRHDLMPIGLVVPVVLVGWAIACALTSWRRLGGVARVPALVLNELPFLAGYLLIASAVLALAQG